MGASFFGASFCEAGQAALEFPGEPIHGAGADWAGRGGGLPVAVQEERKDVVLLHGQWQSGEELNDVGQAGTALSQRGHATAAVVVQEEDGLIRRQTEIAWEAITVDEAMVVESGDALGGVDEHGVTGGRVVCSIKQ